MAAHVLALDRLAFRISFPRLRKIHVKYSNHSAKFQDNSRIPFPSIDQQKRSFSSISKTNFSSSKLLNTRRNSVLNRTVISNPASHNFLFKVHLDNLMSTNSASLSEREALLRKKYEPRELRFKAPYGEIVGLEWGKKTSPHKIFCLHGWLDNAGSFERLVPFILDHGNNSELYHIVSIDQPGVGQSSHLPPGAIYTQFSTLIEIRRVLHQLNWENGITFIAHSLGAHFSYIYSCIFPKQVRAIVSIDLAQPLTRRLHNWNVTIANSIEEHFKVEYHHEDDPTTNIRVPVYSEVDALKRLMDAHSSSLTRESALVLLKRGAKKQRWGYTFTRDLRLRYFSIELVPDDDQMIQRLESTFNPSLLIIRAKNCPYHRPDEVRLRYYELFNKNCPIFRDALLDGTHHLHMNTPELVAPEINKFLDDERLSTSSDQVVINKCNL